MIRLCGLRYGGCVRRFRHGRSIRCRGTTPQFTLDRCIRLFWSIGNVWSGESPARRLCLWGGRAVRAGRRFGGQARAVRVASQTQHRLVVHRRWLRQRRGYRRAQFLHRRRIRAHGQAGDEQCKYQRYAACAFYRCLPFLHSRLALFHGCFLASCVLQAVFFPPLPDAGAMRKPSC